jgi:hypothetical protein
MCILVYAHHKSTIQFWAEVGSGSLMHVNGALQGNYML